MSRGGWSRARGPCTMRSNVPLIMDMGNLHPRGQRDMTENITFPQLCWQPVIIKTAASENVDISTKCE